MIETLSSSQQKIRRMNRINLAIRQNKTNSMHDIEGIMKTIHDVLTGLYANSVNITLSDHGKYYESFLVAISLPIGNTPKLIRYINQNRVFNHSNDKYVLRRHDIYDYFFHDKASIVVLVRKVEPPALIE